MSYLIEVVVREVSHTRTPAQTTSRQSTPEKSERVVEEVTRVVTKAANKNDALRKAKNILDIELDEEDVTEEGSS